MQICCEIKVNKGKKQGAADNGRPKFLIRTFKMTLHKFLSIDELGDIVQLPSKKVVCPRCNGQGTHVNSAIDGNGLTYENFNDNPDFYSAYFKGRYDVICNTCNGQNVVDVLNEDECTPEQIKAHFEYLEDLRQEESGNEAERRAGA